MDTAASPLPADTDPTPGPMAEAKRAPAAAAALLHSVWPEACTPEQGTALRRAQRGDGGPASPVLLLALQRVRTLH